MLSRAQAHVKTADEMHLARRLEHDPEKHALGLDPRVETRFSEKIMLKQSDEIMIRFNLIGS
jgi:hypothetical protein